MKTSILLILAGIIIGGVLFYLILMRKAAGIMLLENESKYDFTETEKLIIESATAKGWKMPANHDLQMTMKNNGFEVLPVKVIEICKPVHAYEILSRDDEKVVSSLMPCRISIYQRSNGKVFISRINSGLMAKPMKGVIPEVMKQATEEIEDIVKPLIK
ncbi:MAG: DUF302 domain-containing protein [Bacteroidales bacterium]